MTVFNRQQYLAQAIESVLASSFRDFELIITDDCSSDGSFDIARAFAERDGRIQAYRNERNLGDYGNRMYAASLARGDYLKYVDSDDTIYRHGLEVMLGNLQQYPSAALALSYSLPEVENPYPILLQPVEAYRRQFLQRGCMGCGPGGAIIRREIFRELGGFDLSWGVLADLEFWFRAAARYPVVLQQPALMWWRTHSGQEFRIGRAEETYLFRGFELAHKALSSDVCPLDAVERDAALRRLRATHARRLLSLGLRLCRPALSISAWRRAGLGVSDFFAAVRRH